MLRHILYCRKSSEDEDRQVLSIESQERELMPIATRERLTIYKKIEESASAKSAGSRAKFNEMVKLVQAGDANAILSWHPNRLSRNAVDTAVLVDLMDQGKLLEIRTPGQVFKNTPGDKFLLTLFCSQAKLENDNKGVDVRRGLRAKIEAGWYPGIAPTGYLNDKTKNRGERDIFNDPDRFGLVKRMWEMLLSRKYTPPQILQIANEAWGFRTRRTKKRGDTLLSLSSLYHIFHNPFYYGWFEYPKGSGTWRQGQHEPMISESEFERAQVFLAQKSHPRPSKHLHFAFTGLIRCGGCAGMVTAEEKHQVICSGCRFKFAYRKRTNCPRCELSIAEMNQPLFLNYTYYHCSQRSRKPCPEPSVEATKLHEQIIEHLGHIEIPTRIRNWAFKYVRELHEADNQSSVQITKSQDKAYEDCLKRIESLVQLKTSPENRDGSLLSDEEYSSQRQKLLAEKARLNQARQDPKLSAEHALHQSEAAFEFARSLRAKFMQGDSDTKKHILATIVSNLTLTDKNLIFEARKPFSLLRTFNSHAKEEKAVSEPKKTSKKYRRKAENEDLLPKGLRELKDVRTYEREQKELVTQLYHFFKKCDPKELETYFWSDSDRAQSLSETSDDGRSEELSFAA